MPFNLGGPELIIVLVIVLIVFGAGKLPNVMRDFGRGVKEFKKAQTDEEIAAEALAASQSQSTSAPGTPPSNTVSSTAAPTTNGVARTPEPAPRA
jgi:sec-independent protein translocase protein TatA